VEPLNIEHAGRTLRGVLHLPHPNPSPAPAVVLCHGFGGNRYEFGYSFLRLAERLSGAGAAAYRFDFAGCGESDGDFTAITVSDQVAQVRTVLAEVARHQAIDPQRLSLLGMSLGGITAALAAPGLGLRSLVLWAPAATAVEANEPAESPFWREAVERGYWDFGGMPVSPAFFEDGKGIDPWKDAAGHDGPVLFASGAGDEVVPERVVDAYREVYADRFEEHRVPGVGHTFETVPARAELLDRTAEFLLRTI
jgi:uncharacterized protein